MLVVQPFTSFPLPNYTHIFFPVPHTVQDPWKWLPWPSEALWNKEVSFLLNVIEQAWVLDWSWHPFHEKEWNPTYDEINTVNGRIKEGNQIFTDITEPLDQLILKAALEPDFPVMWVCCLSWYECGFILFALYRILTDEGMKTDKGMSTEKKVWGWE